jgi:hypothetical protein
MNKSKIDFISDLLAHKNISVVEKERLFELTKDEIRKMENGERFKEIIDRIEKLEREQKEELEREQKEEIAPESQETEKGYPMEHRPREITNYLNKFRENTVLKWTTHVWDESKYTTISEFIDDLNQDKDYRKIFNYNIDLYNLIRYFLYIPYNQEKDERMENGIPLYGFPNYSNIKIGWQYPDNILIDWCIGNFDNKGEYKKYPFEYVLPDNLRPEGTVKGKIITIFENVVDIFKTEIQFRDNYFYQELKKRTNRMSDYQFEGIEQFKNLNFYTYTSGVLSAINIILNEIKRNETEKNIIFSYSFVEDNQLIIDITHQNSIPTKIINCDNPAQFIGGGLNSIAGALFSLCDFSVISKFRDNAGKELQRELSILHEKSKGTREKKNIKLKTPPELKNYTKDIKGFTYQLKFYL